jgi:hypothetical protein
MSAGRAGAPFRQQQAFRWLLEGDGEAAGDQSRRQHRAGGGGSGGGAKGAAAAGKRRSGSGGGAGKSYIPGFQLRADAAAAAAAAAQGSGASGSATDELASLQEAFAEVLPPDVVADVLASCGGNADAAMAALLAMAGGGDAAGPPAAAAAASQQEQRQQQRQQQQQQAPVGPCYWDTLPAHLTHLIFEQLSLRWAHESCHDLALASGTAGCWLDRCGWQCPTNASRLN